MMDEVRRKIGFRGLIVIAAFSLVIAVVTIASGSHGIYMFDASIPLLFGHLIRNGRFCFNEILMPPLGPLSGYLAAFAYILFGNSYMAAVCLAGIVCGIGSVIILYLLAGRMNLVCAACCTALLTLSTVPVPGILFYNDLGLLLVGILFALGCERCCDDNQAAWPGRAMWITVGLLFLNKPNIGFMFGIGLWVLEFLFFLRQRKQFKLRRIFDALIIVGVSALLFLLSARFNASDVLASLFIVEIPDSLYSFLFNNCYILGGVWNSYFISGFLLVLLIAVMQYSKCRPKEKMLYAWAGIIWFFLFSNSFLSCYVWPAQFFAIAVIAAVFFIWKNGSRPSRALWAGLILPVFYTAVLGVLIYRGGYNLKTWNELKADFSADLSNTVRCRSGFFKGALLQKHQLLMVNLIDEISGKMPEKKIFFGPELGVLYPLTGRMPPNPWFLWEDQRLVLANSDRVIMKLNSENFDIMVMPMKPQAPPAYLDYLFAIQPLEITVPECGLVFRFRSRQTMAVVSAIISEVKERISADLANKNL